MPGRRFKGYTDREFLEAYFGKDMMRVGVLDKKQDAIFMPQETLKSKFPVSQFLKSPAIDKKLQKLKDMGFSPSYETLEGLNVYPSDKEIKKVIKIHEKDYEGGSFKKNEKHPEDSKRSRLGDMESMLEKYERNRKNRNMEGTYKMRETRTLINRINEEYPKVKRPKSDWFKDI